MENSRGKILVQLTPIQRVQECFTTGFRRFSLPPLFYLPGGRGRRKKSAEGHSKVFILFYFFRVEKLKKRGKNVVGNGGRMMMYRARVRSMQRAENALLAAIHCNSVTSGSPV